MDSDADILLLLDCCYAAQAARATEGGSGRLEILAASSYGNEDPGSRSFTRILLNEMRDAVARDGFVDIKDLHGHLCGRR